MSKERVCIKIQGAKGSGKTAILHDIASALKTLGYNITCFDDGRKVDPHAYGLLPDQRLIRITTHET